MRDAAPSADKLGVVLGRKAARAIALNIGYAPSGPAKARAHQLSIQSSNEGSGRYSITVFDDSPERVALRMHVDARANAYSSTARR